jgi:hypothetical protein
MTVREIQGHLAELYGTEVSPDLISRVTDAVVDEVRESPASSFHLLGYLHDANEPCLTIDRSGGAGARISDGLPLA